MLHLTLASRNAHKTREFSAILGPQFVVSDLTKHPQLAPVEETGTTFQANAILKALAASKVISGLVVADDSGLEVDALGGEPGVYSARYAGKNATDAKNVAKLLSELSFRPSAASRSAQFRCVLALAQGGQLLSVFEGAVEGQISSDVQGCGGFGYDPIFLPEGSFQSFAELGSFAKNRISHRARAVAKLRTYFVAQGPE